MKVVVRINEHSALYAALAELPARARAERLRELALLGLYRPESGARESAAVSQETPQHREGEQSPPDAAAPVVNADAAAAKADRLIDELSF